MLYLASGSPRRHQLLAGLDVPFEVRVKPDIDETFPAELRRHEVAEFLAHHKAAAYDAEIAAGHAVLTADTIVCLGDEILNKPVDVADAGRMLRALAGRRHDVFTGVCLRTPTATHVLHDRTEVTFRPLTEAEITYYVTRYRPFDKAGAYGAQDWLGMSAITALRGSYFTVMGLPTHLVHELLLRYLPSDTEQVA